MACYHIATDALADSNLDELHGMDRYKACVAALTTLVATRWSVA